MPIRRKPEPPEARPLLYSALAERTRHARHIDALRGTPSLSAPLPVYALAQKFSARPHPLRHVRLSGWIFLIVGGAATGLAHLSVNRGTLRFAGITDGVAAQRLLETAILAQTEFGAGGRSFEARVLEIPYLRVHALWLYARGGGSRFSSLDTADGAGAASASLSEFELRIAAASADWGGRGGHGDRPRSEGKRS